MKCKWYNYYSDGQNPTSCCDSGEYYYFYDALGNVNGVLDSGGHYYRWEMDAFGNDLPSGNSFLDMDQPGPKEHLTGKMFDTATGLYYFPARWYDPQVGRFLSVNLSALKGSESSPCGWGSMRDPDGYYFVQNSPTMLYDTFGTVATKGCNAKYIGLIAAAAREARDALKSCIRCRVPGRVPGNIGIRKTVAKDIMSALTSATIECIPNPTGGKAFCGRVDKIGGTVMQLTPAGVLSLNRGGFHCPCLSALLIHEATHLVGKDEKTAEACENDCSTCATRPGPGEAGGHCHW